MNRAIIVSVAAMLLSAGPSLAQSAPSVPAGHQVGEEAAVLAALDRYVHAISARDLRTMAALQMPDGMTYVARPKEGDGIEIVGRPNTYWLIPNVLTARASRAVLVANGPGTRADRRGVGAL